MSPVEAESLRREIWSRKNQLSATTHSLTPSGRQRASPSFSATIRNVHLEVSKEIKASSLDGLTEKARTQFATWNLEEFEKKATDQSRRDLELIQDLLRIGLRSDGRLEWDSLLDGSEFPPFEAYPEVSLCSVSPLKPPEPLRRPLVEFLVPPLRRKRLTAIETLRAQHQKAIADYRQRREALRQKFEADRSHFYASQQQRNSVAEDLRSRFDVGERGAVEEYAVKVLTTAAYPAFFGPKHEAAFDPDTKTLICDVSLPTLMAMPVALRYRIDSQTGQVVADEMKQAKRDELYDTAIKQIMLRTLHHLFVAVPFGTVTAVVANGWVTAVEPATGQEVTRCIISISTTRESFRLIDLSRVEVTACIKSLKGILAGPLAQLAPVRPILQLDRNDRRFVASKDVLADTDSQTNLAEIPWEEFEQLVRELFGEMFDREGSEVRVTQASRDGGVDAVAFDPDPIRGGKFVIQAKRYTNVVPVSAVRDLYGTMINEGASKGILVTTAYYGPDSREFAKDKPLTLIDGSNLVYLLEQHGHKVRIDIVSARAARRGNG